LSLRSFLRTRCPGFFDVGLAKSIFSSFVVALFGAGGGGGSAAKVTPDQRIRKTRQIGRNSIAMKVSLILAAVTWGFAASAHQPEDGHIYGTGGLLSYRTHTQTHKFGSPLLVSPGLIAEGDLGRHGGLEISMFYVRNPFSIQRDAKVYTQWVKRMYIATGYRYWITPWISTGLALSSTYSMGDPHTVRDDWNGAVDRPGTSASDTTEYGFAGSVQVELFREKRYTFLVDGRYDYSVTGKRGEDSNYYGIFFGLKYFIQAREKIDDEDL
jgi:hypothetical protein